MRRFLFAFFASVSLLHAQSNIIIDGTSGTNSTSTSYSTDSGLNLSLGFFADYLVVGGGGGGGGASEPFRGAGGGGAGGLLQGATNLVSSNYSVVVGAGGLGGANTSTNSLRQGQSGSNSVFGALTAVGGGGGGAGGDQSTFAGNNGGSGGGGGGGGNSLVTGASGGTGTDGQGTSGGASVNNAAPPSSNNRWAGGGGGGAGSEGTSGNQAPGSDGFARGGNGGTGAISTITGSSVTYAGGGGGGAVATATIGSPSSIAGTGGTGGGGNGAAGNNGGANGVNGLGGGGGGAGQILVHQALAGGKGGSGVVIVRYQGNSVGNIGGTVTAGTGTAAGYTLHTFTDTGSANFNMSGVNMSQRLGATLSGNLTGSGGVTYNGPGRLSLTGISSYSGATTISSGTLAINGDSSAATGSVTVSSGATLGGSGTVGGATTIQSGAVHAPGNSPGLQTFNNGLTYSTGSTFQWELIGNSVDGRGTTYDAVNVTGGTLSIGTGVTSSLVFNASGSSVSWSNAFWNENRSWLVFDNANSPTLTGSVFSTINLSDDINNLQLTDVRPDARFSWNQQGSDVYLTYTAVPEPSTYALLALAAAGLGAQLWRRRR